MQPRPSRLVLAILCALVAARAHTARAQSSGDTSTSVAHAGLPVAVWASVGLGPGSIRGATSTPLAGVVRANVSIGSILLTYRGNDVGPFFAAGDGVRDGAVLAGVRTGGHRLFGAAALGYARANSYHQCSDFCGVPLTDPSVGALAYDITAHANYIVPGLSVSFSGDIGPSRVTYSAVTVAFELGWFGL